MTLTTSVKTCFQKYATFSGQTSRSEFWYFYLSVKGMIFVSAIVFIWAAVIVYVVTLVPAHAAAVRRLRDQDRWVWPILILSPIILVANLFFLAALDDKLYASEPEVFFVVTIIWALPIFRAFWILTGPSAQPAPSDQNNEVTP
ncbi:DUF805 domain-containing protein [uncultured Tateyamaria sp.]|uniref:DUF805 domain-containing protein n=1 Tax=uncultured Tateyamaria sp. TaxID=455651 RepID=UPI002634F749|nr:DUF805 domain-containing protein [uncultured Tateyamaria sp.]